MVIRTFRNLFQALLLLAALVATSLLFTVLTMHFAIHGAEVRVPSLRGMTLDEARTQTAGLDLNLAVDHSYYSTDVASGHIVSQSPPPGTVVRREWQVRVSQSLGPQRVIVPAVIGEEERTAMLTLRGNGLQSGVSAHLPDHSQASGTVIAQDPPANAVGIEQPFVHLLVAIPDTSEVNGFVMPDLVGMSINNARAPLAKAGIELAPLRTVDNPVQSVAAVLPQGTTPAPVHPLIQPGSIVHQEPAAGTRIAVGDRVFLTVAR